MNTRFLFVDLDKYRQKEKCPCCGGFNTNRAPGLTLNFDYFSNGEFFLCVRYGVVSSTTSAGLQCRLCDDFSGYKACFEMGVTEAGCLAHAHRKFHRPP